VIGDNPAFRVALHAFAGVSAGYITYIVLIQVIVNKLVLPLVIGSLTERILLSFPLIFMMLLLGKLSPSTEWLGRPVVAFLLGIGTAATIGGAVFGTIFPQVLSGASMFQGDPNLTTGALATKLVIGLCALIGTIATLAYFQFTIRGNEAVSAKRSWFATFLAVPGQIFISITLGAIFAGVLAAALTAFIDRVQAIIDFVFLFIS